MKRLTYPLLLASALWLVSCEAPSDSSTSVMRPGPSSNGHGGGGTTTPATPALAFIGSATSHGNTYRTISVMDSDYTHQTAIFGDAATSYSYTGPSWSPNNGSIAFMQNTGTTAAPVNSIRAVDVTVSSTGTVSGTNARTIFSLPSGQIDNWLDVAWSNTSSTNMIAFCTAEVADTRRTVWVVPATGGTPVKVWESDSTFVKEDGSKVGHSMPVALATWSPDDSRIAFERLDSGRTGLYSTSGVARAVTIMIFSTTDNGSTWTYTDSIKHTSTGTNAYYYDMQWSRTGLNSLALWYKQDDKLYYATPSSTSSITTYGITAGGLSWSPNNSSIHHTLSTNMWKSVPFTTTVTMSSVANPSYGNNWQIRWRH